MSTRNLLKGVALYLLVAYGLVTAYANLVRYAGLPTTGLTPFLTILAFGFAVLHAIVSLGLPRALLFVALTFAISLVLESVGVLTGLVYGPYHYTTKLGPMFLGLVPYLIPLAYFMMIYPARVIAEGLIGDRLGGGRRRVVGLALASAVAVTAWDVLMDPMMVRLGFWVWEVDGGYFGVPLHNYAGWLATTFCVYALYGWLERRLKPVRLEFDPPFVRLAVWSYSITWLGNSAAALELGLQGPVLAGAFSIGIVALLALFLVPSRPRATMPE